MTVTQAAPEPSNQDFIKLLATFDGGGGSNEPRDRSNFSNTPTLGGTAVVQSVDQWFGCPSAADTAAAGTVNIPITAASFGAATDFVIEFFTMSDVSHATDTIIQLGVSPQRSFRLRWNGGGNGELGVSVDGTTYTTTTFALNNSSSANWFFFHIERSSGEWSIWVATNLETSGGTPEAPNDDPATRLVNAFAPGDMHIDASQSLVFGAAPDFSDPTQLYLDTMRITIGEAYYPAQPATIPVPAATNCDLPYVVPTGCLPLLTTPIPDQLEYLGVEYEKDFSYFFSQPTGLRSTYSVDTLPDGLVMVDNGVVTGAIVAPAIEGQVFVVTVTATNDCGTDSDTLNFTVGTTVAAANDSFVFQHSSS